jgi:hypothetical protein
MTDKPDKIKSNKIEADEVYAQEGGPITWGHVMGGDTDTYHYAFLDGLSEAEAHARVRKAELEGFELDTSGAYMHLVTVSAYGRLMRIARDSQAYRRLKNRHRSSTTPVENMKKISTMKEQVNG